MRITELKNGGVYFVVMNQKPETKDPLKLPPPFPLGI